jgi:GNAT superfamily N-acetyltransferase
VDGELPELRRIASWARERGGEFWVAEIRGRIGGMCGYKLVGDDGVELVKLYVHRTQRTTGLGSILVDRVEAAARRLGRTYVEMWSDTRFQTAHKFYERRGYARGSTRNLNDKSNTVEFYFRKELV